MDLLNCIFSSTNKALRDSEYTNLLKLYYESLSKTIRMLGSNPDNLFTFENLQDEMKGCGNSALFFAPAVIAVSIDGILNFKESFDKITNRESEQNSVCDTKTESQLQYSERLEGLLDDIVNFGYYRKFSAAELSQLQ